MTHQPNSATDPRAGREVYQRIAANIARIMQGQAASTRKLLAALASGGHVLLEDFPGTGKTTLAKALARSIDAGFKRIQFTPDLLPSDILVCLSTAQGMDCRSGGRSDGTAAHSGPDGLGAQVSSGESPRKSLRKSH